MARLVLSQRVEAPREVVFDVFSDFRSVAERVSGVTRCEVLTEGPIRAGTLYRETREFGGREATEEMEITEFRRPLSYRVEGESCGSRWVCDMRFEPRGSATEVTMEFVTRPASLKGIVMAPVALLMRGMVRRCIQTDLDELKRFIEDGARAPATQPV